MPSSLVWTYSPVNGRSVPFSRSTLYCSSDSCSRQRASSGLSVWFLNKLMWFAGPFVALYQFDPTGRETVHARHNRFQKWSLRLTPRATRRMADRTQVAIIGAGPAGLLLGQLLHR